MLNPQIAVEIGVSESLLTQWQRKTGGVPPRPRKAPTGRYLTLEDRETIALRKAAGVSHVAIAVELKRSVSTVGRELTRNSDPLRSGGNITREYRASTAQRRADKRAERPKPAKLRADVNPALHDQVQADLKLNWSPEQISQRLKVAFPDRLEMRVSPETIYQALYVQSRGALKRELTKHLRTGRAIRRPQARGTARRPRVPAELLIANRPAEVTDRAVPGHWEGDLITGAMNGSAIGTLVERTSRFCLLLHLPERHGAEEVRDALSAALQDLPAALRGSVTWDQGIELIRHAEIKLATDVDIWFCDPHSPWQRGTNENTNGLLRQYFAKGTDLSVHSAARLRDVAYELNGRPRKTLGWKNPREALNELLLATTA
jgi:IS30 family transposase